MMLEIISTLNRTVSMSVSQTQPWLKCTLLTPFPEHRGGAEQICAHRGTDGDHHMRTRTHRRVRLTSQAEGAFSPNSLVHLEWTNYHDNNVSESEISLNFLFGTFVFLVCTYWRILYNTLHSYSRFTCSNMHLLSSGLKILGDKCFIDGNAPRRVPKYNVGLCPKASCVAPSHEHWPCRRANWTDYTVKIVNMVDCGMVKYSALYINTM